MNGIIHNCTHKDAGEDVSFRLSEEEMFIRIFNYIEHLFGKIKPKQLFFMAIDGVAPRAKMNQQRSRRFRTALDAEKAREKAIKEGVEIPKEEPFDSNCITPGMSILIIVASHNTYALQVPSSWPNYLSNCDTLSTRRYLKTLIGKDVRLFYPATKSLVRENTRLWNTFEMPRLSPTTITMFGIVFTVLMPI
jgi:hypothetical protein